MVNPSWVSFMNSVLLLLIGALIGFGVWFIQKKLAALTVSALNHDACLDEKSLLDMETQGVLLELGIVTGKAVKEGMCNGEMTNALATALEMQDKRASFLARMARDNLKHIK